MLECVNCSVARTVHWESIRVTKASTHNFTLPNRIGDPKAHSQRGFDFEVLGHILPFFNLLRFRIP